MSIASPDAPPRPGSAEPGQGGRIAFVVTSLKAGRAGAAGVAGASWMTWFVERGYEVTALVVSDPSRSSPGPQGVTVRRLTGRRGYAASLHAAKVQALRALLRREKYDTVVAIGTAANVLTIAASPSRAVRDRPTLIVTEQNLVSLGLPGSARSHRAQAWLARRSYRRADAVTSASHPIGAEMAAAFGVPPSRSLVVPSPALKDGADRTVIRRVPGIERGIQLVVASRLVAEENPHAAVYAAHALEARGIPTEVVSFGGGPLRKELTDLAATLGVRFTVHEWRDDWIAQSADNAVVLLPSTRDGLGTALIEAAARGVPSVGISTALGVTDAVIPGVTGELAFDDEPDSIADAVVRAAGLEVEGVDAWLDRFTAEGSGSALEQVIEYAGSLRP